MGISTPESTLSLWIIKSPVAPAFCPLSLVACHARELVPRGLRPEVPQVRSPVGEGLVSRTEGGTEQLRRELEPAREGTADLEMDWVQNRAMSLTFHL